MLEIDLGYSNVEIILVQLSTTFRFENFCILSVACNRWAFILNWKKMWLTNFSFKNNPTLHLNFWSVLRENFVWTVFIHVCSCSLFVPFNNQSVTVAYFPHMLTWHQLLNSNLCPKIFLILNRWNQNILWNWNGELSCG